MKELRCSDVGFDCQGIVRGSSEDDVLRQAAEHARAVHRLDELDDETVRFIRSRIRTVQPATV